jgi:hypothetical protein
LRARRNEVLVPAMRQALDRSRIVLDQQAEMRALRGSYASLTLANAQLWGWWPPAC